MNPLAIVLPAPIGYAHGLRVQQALHAARRSDQIPDVALFLEHRPVITLGRRGRTEHLLAEPERLEALGIELHVASRGGDVTYHGPGQLVVYPILKLEGPAARSRRYLWNLEEVAVRTASAFGVHAVRRDGMSGAWCEQGKLAAIGFHLKRWVTLHGMSFNVDPDLAAFSLIVGCGLVGEPVTSLREVLGPEAPALAQVRERMIRILSEVMGQPFQPWDIRQPLPPEWNNVPALRTLRIP